MRISPEIRAIVNLFDDDDPVVKDAIDRYLSVHFPQIEDELLSVLAGEMSHDRFNKVFGVIFRHNAEHILTQLSKSIEDGDCDCFRLWFMICKIIIPTSVYEVSLAAMLTLQGRISSSLKADMTPQQKVEVLNKVFFDDLNIKQLTTENVPLAALLPSEVLYCGQGVPLVIDMLYVFLAEMSGFPVGVLLSDEGFAPCWNEHGRAAFVMKMESKGEIIPPDEVSVTDTNVHDTIVLLDIYAGMMSDIFRISGEEDKSVMMSRIRDILISKK